MGKVWSPRDFRGGSALGHFSLRPTDWPLMAVNDQLMTQLMTEIKKTQFLSGPRPILGGVDSRSFFAPANRLACSVRNDGQTYKQTHNHYGFCPAFSAVRTHLLRSWELTGLGYFESDSELTGLGYFESDSELTGPGYFESDSE